MAVSAEESVRLVVDPGKCTGHARCNAINDSLFPLDDDGYAAFSGQIFTGTDAARAQSTVNACPERAISAERPLDD